ncbi:MAG: hypothetical protein RR055_07060 [Oscillospiraceae bacterium]
MFTARSFNANMTHGASSDTSFSPCALNVILMDTVVMAVSIFVVVLLGVLLVVGSDLLIIAGLLIILPVIILAGPAAEKPKARSTYSLFVRT